MDIATDSDGFLLDSDDWDEGVAKYIASLSNLILTEEHWNFIRIIRENYYEHDSVPE